MEGYKPYEVSYFQRIKCCSKSHPKPSPIAGIAVFPLPRSSEDVHNSLLWFKSLEILWVHVNVCVCSSANACVYPYTLCAQVCAGQKTILTLLLSQVPKPWASVFYCLGDHCESYAGWPVSSKDPPVSTALPVGFLRSSYAHRKCFTSGAVSPAFKHCCSFSVSSQCEPQEGIKD